MDRRLALRCLIPAVSLLAFAAHPSNVTVLGEWYDDLGSPKFLDAKMRIEREGERYFMVRQSGDGSGIRTRLDRDGDKFFKVGDTFGAMYRITAKGLEIHDRRGYIRTAQKR